MIALSKIRVMTTRRNKAELVIEPILSATVPNSWVYILFTPPP